MCSTIQQLVSLFCRIALLTSMLMLTYIHDASMFIHHCGRTQEYNVFITSRLNYIRDFSVLLFCGVSLLSVLWLLLSCKCLDMKCTTISPNLSLCSDLQQYWRNCHYCILLWVMSNLKQSIIFSCRSLNHTLLWYDARILKFCLQTVTHPRSNPAWHRSVRLMERRMF